MKTLAQLKIGMIAASLVVTACGKDSPSFSLAPASTSFKQSPSSVNNKIDILFVVDNSGSMDPSQTNLVNNFTSFINGLQSKAYDFKIAVTTSDTYLADPLLNDTPTYAKFKDGITTHSGIFVISPVTPNLTNVFVNNAITGSSGSGDERAFSSFRSALNSPSNVGFHRPDAFLSIVILSDEDDFSGDTRCEGCVSDHNYGLSSLETVASYEAYLDQFTGSTPSLRTYSVSAIATLDSTCATYRRNNGSPSAIIGQRYMQIANDTQGVLGSICDTSFANSLDLIQSKISELSTRFILDRIPVVSSIVVTVNGIMIGQNAANGWTYDATANAIVFHGGAVPVQGSTIQVNFNPVTIK